MHAPSLDSLTRPRPRVRSPWGQLLSDFNALCRLYLSRRAHRAGEVGAKTRRERRVVLRCALRDLHESNPKLELRRTKNFREKHLYQVLSNWRQKRLKASTLSTYVSHLRTFCGWLNKPQLIRLINEYVAAEPESVKRRTVTDTDRSERSVNLNVHETLDRAKELDERFAAQLALILAFGLRSQESWLFRPHLALGADDVLRVRWGTKGGRPRELQGELTLEHRKVLEWAQTFAKSRAESMIPRGWTVQRWRRRYYWLCERIGLTRCGLGVTPHAFRHGVLLDLYEWVVKQPAAARGGTLAQTDPDADRAAREIVALHGGHGDFYSSSPYLGGRRPRTPKKKRGEGRRRATGSDLGAQSRLDGDARPDGG